MSSDAAAVPTNADDAAASALEPTTGPLTFEELELAFRNRGMPLEALRYDLTPTGLHYLVIHWDIPDVDASTWRLDIGGRVKRRLSISLADLMARPAQTVRVTLECAGNGRARLSPRPLSVPWLTEAVGTADWTGTSLWPILEDAGITDDVVEFAFLGLDRGVQTGVDHEYGRSLTVAEARRPEVMLAYAMNGQPLQPQHGFPLRLIVPGWYGMTSVKWLRAIEALSEPFDGFQQAVAYHYKGDADDPGEPVQRIRVRALMIPPGIPDFFSRARFVEPGPVRIEGRAWSGEGTIERVEVGVDGTWLPADLGPPAGEFAWRSWTFPWTAIEGAHELTCRATDSGGSVQPTIQPWNFQGHGNNLVQTVAVTVRR